MGIKVNASQELIPGSLFLYFCLGSGRRYYDACRYLDINLGYTFGKKVKTTVYVEMNNLLNQPLRYYIGGNRDITTQVEYYGRKISFGLKVNI